jgi:hypothetical protein
MEMAMSEGASTMTGRRVVTADSLNMSENYLVWGPVAEFAGRYSMMNEKGEIVPDPETQQMVKRKLTALRQFFSDNKLLNVEVFDAKGNLIDIAYRRNDFTAEGIELLRRKEGAWLKSKASTKNPPDLKLLEKALAEIRAGK